MQRHHDIEPGFADIPHVFLQFPVIDFDDTVGQAKIGHELGQSAKPSLLISPVVTGKLDQQNRVRITAYGSVYRIAKRRVLAGQGYHGAVHQLDRGRFQLDDMLR